MMIQIDRSLGQRRADLHASSHQLTANQKRESLIGLNAAELKAELGNSITLGQLDAQAVASAEKEEALWNEANRDPLTGIPNRRYFTSVLGQQIQAARTRGQKIQVGMVDANGLKRVNDFLGHKNGDLYLQRIAQHLQDTVGSDLYGRFGGDEFAFATGDFQTALNYAAKIKDDIKKDSTIGEGTPINGSVSVGIAEDDITQPDIFNAMDSADKMMYVDKRTTRK